MCINLKGISRVITILLAQMDLDKLKFASKRNVDTLGEVEGRLKSQGNSAINEECQAIFERKRSFKLREKRERENY